MVDVNQFMLHLYLHPCNTQNGSFSSETCQKSKADILKRSPLGVWQDVCGCSCLLLLQRSILLVPPQSVLTRVLCLSGQNASRAPRADAEEASSSRRNQPQLLRATYLSDVKRALDKSAYSRFHEALLAYKKTDNYDAMISVIAALTTERPEDFHLLRSKGPGF